MPQQIIGVRDLLSRFKQISERVEKGQTYIVVKNSKPLLQLTPYFDTEESLDKIIPSSEEHKSIIEAHRDYLKGKTYSGKQIKEMIKSGTL